jgi:hypothetical protein
MVIKRHVLFNSFGYECFTFMINRTDNHVLCLKKKEGA